MKKNIIIAIALLAALGGAQAKKAKKVVQAPAPIELKSSSDSLSYAAGYANTQGLIPFLQQQYKVDTAYMADFIQGFKEAREKVNDPRYNAYAAGGQVAKIVEDRMITGMSRDLTDAPDSLVADLFYAGFAAALEKDSTVFVDSTALAYFQNNMKRNQDAKNERLYGENRRKGEAFLAENAKKEGVVTLPSGLQYKVITMGDGPKPSASNEVHVRYEGHLIDSTEFDSSYKRNPDVTKFRANKVIKGWTEALTMMPIGSKWELYIPYQLGYGEHKQGKIDPYSALIFTVELTGITGVEWPKKTEETAAATATAAKKTTAKKAVTKKK